jgi:hypothetical protein
MFCNVWVIYTMLEQYYDKNGWDQYVESNELGGADEYIKTFPNIKYIGHGGTCIAFTNNDTQNHSVVIKVCLKKRMVANNSNSFLAFSKCLQNNGIKILPIIDILYEDNTVFIYSQSFCHTIFSINSLVLSKILKIIKKLIQCNIKITDLFYKNFGIHNNEVFLYDYHDYGFYYTDDHYYLTHIAHLFNTYYNNELLHGITLDFNKLKEMNFGKDYFPTCVVEFIESMYMHQLDHGFRLITNIISEIDSKITKTFDDYQHFDIDTNGELQLRSHTLEKYNAFYDLTKLFPTYFENKFTIIDFGCSLGGIGTKIAQQFPESRVVLNNITLNELSVCDQNIKNSCITNIKTSALNVIDETNTYDVCMYYALLHHILKIKTFTETIELVYRQTIDYAIIELPFGSDALLKKVINDSVTRYEESFKYLESIDTFHESISRWFTVLFHRKINYGSDDLNRYVFALRKISSS